MIVKCDLLGKKTTTCIYVVRDFIQLPHGTIENLRYLRKGSATFVLMSFHCLV